MHKQIKTKKRVKDFGEVFTNEREIRAMCDLIPVETWTNIESTFLEPSCGTGNFLIEILNRKLQHCNSAKDEQKAYASIYGIDIQSDNIEECKTRLLSLHQYNTSDQEIINILNRNIVCGDFLTKLDKNGKPIWFLQ